MVDCTLPIIAAHCAAADKMEAAIWAAHDFVVGAACVVAAILVLRWLIYTLCDLVMGSSR